MAIILLIDDDDLLRGMLAKTLELEGHTVFQADNGQAGIDLFHSQRPDLVITDLVMPVQEGVETIMRLRQLSPRLPIIAMSGGVPNSKLYLTIAAKIGAHRILPKPFTPQRLLEAVNETLRESPPAS